MNSINYLFLTLVFALSVIAQTQDDIIAMNNCIANCPTVNPEAESCYIECINTNYIEKQVANTPSVANTATATPSSSTPTVATDVLPTPSNTDSTTPSSTLGNATTTTSGPLSTSGLNANETLPINSNNTLPINSNNTSALPTTSRTPTVATNSVVSLEDSAFSLINCSMATIIAIIAINIFLML